MRGKTRRAMVTALLLLVGGCDDSDQSSSTTTDRDPASAAPGGSVEDLADTLSDGEIAGVLNALHESEISQAERALERLRASDVRQFAEQTIAEHRAADERQRTLMRRLSIRSKESALSTQLLDDAQQAMTTVAEAADMDVDVLYIQQQVRGHEALLTALDDTLIPSAEDSELMLELLGTRDEINGHLNHARRLFDALVGKR